MYIATQGVLTNLSFFDPMQIKYCSMHSLNLGVSLWIAAGAILFLRDDLQLWGGPDMTAAEKLSSAWMHFVAWAKQRKIQCFDGIVSNSLTDFELSDFENICHHLMIETCLGSCPFWA